MGQIQFSGLTLEKKSSALIVEPLNLKNSSVRLSQLQFIEYVDAEGWIDTKA